MQLHRFYAKTAGQVETLPMNLAMFQAAHPGRYIDFVPDGYGPCRAGFRPYRTDAGQILGVKFWQPDLKDPTTLETENATK